MKKLLLILGIFLLTALPLAALTQTYDPLVSEQWYLKQINALDAWEITKGSDVVVVAVLDTGVDITHPDLSNNIWVNMDEYGGDGIDNDNNGYIDDINGWDFVYDWPDPTPGLDFYYDDIIHHGTFIAGIISGMENGRGITGLASKVKIMPLKVLDEFGMGDSGLVSEAIDYAVDNGADIINLSLAGYDDTAELTRTIERANENNVIIVASAGNGFWGYGIDLAEQPVYPICYDKENDPRMLVIGVGSTGKEDLPSEFSNFGIECLDVSAPGEDMFSTKIHQLAQTEEEYYGNGSEGTSFSSALISGTVALMRSLNRSVNIADIILALEEGAVPIELPFYMEEGDMGVGRIDVYNSLQSILLKHGISTSKSDWNVLTSQASGGVPNFKVLNRKLETEHEVKVFNEEFAQGLTVTSFDINNDGNSEYIAAPAKGGPALLRVFSLDKKLIASNFIYEKDFSGGLNLSSITLKDGTNKLLTCTGPGRQTEFAYFNDSLKKEKAFAPFNNDFGCRAAAGDVNNDGLEEIVVSSLKGAEIKIYDQKGELINSFTAYDRSVDGVNVDVADMNDDGSAEIITGPVKGPALVKVFDKDGESSVSFVAYNSGFDGGVMPKATDFDNHEYLDIITAPGRGGGPHLKIFDLLGKVLFEKFIYEKDFTGGLNIATVY